MAPISNFIDHCLFVCILLVSKKYITSHCSYRQSSQVWPCMFQHLQYLIFNILRDPASCPLRLAYHISPQYLLVRLHNKSSLTHSTLINNQIWKIAKNTTRQCRVERKIFYLKLENFNRVCSVKSVLNRIYVPFYTGWMPSKMQRLHWAGSHMKYKSHIYRYLQEYFYSFISQVQTLLLYRIEDQQHWYLDIVRCECGPERFRFQRIWWRLNRLSDSPIDLYRANFYYNYYIVKSISQFSISSQPGPCRPMRSSEVSSVLSHKTPRTA